MNFYIIVEKCDAIFAQKVIRKKSYCNQALKSDRIAKLPRYNLWNVKIRATWFFVFAESCVFFY